MNGQTPIALTILSYNLWVHKAYDELPALIEEFAVDVLCLQECKTQELVPAIAGLSLARSDTLGRLGLAMYVRKERWFVVRDEYRRLPKAAYEKALRAADRTRLQMLELQGTEDEAVRAVVANVHIAHLGASGLARRKQAVHAGKMATGFAPGGIPLVLSGDFNHPFGEARLVHAMQQVGLEHATRPEGRLVTYSRWPRQTFDRMFYKDTDLLELKVLPFGSSDHAPILGTFQII